MIKVLQLKRVFFPVKQFPVVEVGLVVMYKLEAISDYAVVRVDSVWNGKFLVVVIETRTPVGGSFTFTERNEASALHVVWGLDVSNLQKRLGKVD